MLTRFSPFRFKFNPFNYKFNLYLNRNLNSIQHLKPTSNLDSCLLTIIMAAPSPATKIHSRPSSSSASSSPPPKRAKLDQDQEEATITPTSTSHPPATASASTSTSTSSNGNKNNFKPNADKAAAKRVKNNRKTRSQNMLKTGEDPIFFDALKFIGKDRVAEIVESGQEWRQAFKRGEEVEVQIMGLGAHGEFICPESEAWGSH